MEIYNVKSIEIINQENMQKTMKQDMLIQTLSKLMMENRKKDMFNMQLVEMINKLNMKLEKMEGK